MATMENNPFECKNCGHKPSASEIIDKHGDCPKCGDTVIAYTVDAAVALQAATDFAFKEHSARCKAEDDNAGHRAALGEACDMLARGGSRIYLQNTHPHGLECLDRWNALLGRPRHERMKI